MCLFIWPTYCIYKANALRHYLTPNWHVCFTLILKKTGSCSGRVLSLLFLLHLKKNLGRVPGVFSVFSVFQSLSNSKKKGKQTLHSYDCISYRVCKNYYKIRKQSRLEAYFVYKHTQKPDLPISNTH